MRDLFKQKYMSVVYRGFSLYIIISYDSEEQLQELNTLIDKILFTDGLQKRNSDIDKSLTELSR